MEVRLRAGARSAAIYPHKVRKKGVFGATVKIANIEQSFFNANGR